MHLSFACSIKYCTKGILQPIFRKVSYRAFCMKFVKVYRVVFFLQVLRLFFLVPDVLHRRPLPNKLRFNWGLCFGLLLVDAVSHKSTARSKQTWMIEGGSYIYNISICPYTYLYIDLFIYLLNLKKHENVSFVEKHTSIDRSRGSSSIPCQ